MSNDPDDIAYRGPRRDVRPTIGGNRGAPEEGYLSTEAAGGYANVDWLHEMLDKLIVLTGEILVEFDAELSGLALRIRNTAADARLRQAYAAEWGDTEADLPDTVPYKYYRALRRRTTASSEYIRDRWEQAAQNVSGTPVFDLVDVVDTMRSEAFLVKEFLDSYVGDVSDSSEKRTIELFQDWAASALQRAQGIYEVGIRKIPSRTLPASEVDSEDPKNAAQYQALFAVRLTELNKKVRSKKSDFQRNFNEYADVFYHRHLGPAMAMRLNVTKGLYPTNGQVGAEIAAAKVRTEGHLELLLTDQLRRNEAFNLTVDDYVDLVRERDTYRVYLQQLATIGVEASSATSLPQLVTLTESEIDFFPEWEGSDLDSATPVFDAPHSFLSGRDDPNAHPQYVLRSGGTITGDINVDSGVKIDGIDLDQHDHDGVNSKKIKGSNIEGGTLGTGVIDTDAKPPRPTGLRLVNQIVRSIPPGTSVVDVQLSWVGPADYEYEIQYSVIED